MILTVTPNLALDITYHVERVRHGETVRVQKVLRRAGGKGVNVARVLHALGRDVVVTGLLGGFAGAAARAELHTSGMKDETVTIDGETRLTVIVVDDDGAATGFSEPGPQIEAHEWNALVARWETLVRSAEGVVLAGSLPPGVPEDGYARLIELAAATGVPALVDTEGGPLEHAVRAGPTIAKVNAQELASAVASADVVEGAQRLCDLGAGAAVITRGAEGVIAVAEDRVLHAPAPQVLMGNPTGAGDAVSASLIAGAVAGTPWRERLDDAVALSAAAVAAPVAGSFDEELYRRLR